MPNQRDIARALGISQAAVSLALRGDRSISSRLRQRVTQTANKLGYRPNPYVSSLMARIQEGRRATEKGVLALIIDRFSRAEWLRHASYSVYHQGVVRRAAALGFGTELFFLKEPGVAPAAIDRILHARGIHGVILAPPYLSNRRIALTWERYACAGTGYGWEQQQMDRVAHDHDQNAALAFGELCRLGYRRIGLCLPRFYAQGRGTRWVDGFLTCQHKLPSRHRVPVFTGSEEEGDFPRFQAWVGRHRPDALLCLYGHERAWLTRLGLHAPRDIGLACLIRPPRGRLAGIDDRYGEVGAATVDLVASKIAFNQRGIPPFPRITLIEGIWVPGSTAVRHGPAVPLDF